MSFVLHIPHASTRIPADIRSRLKLDDGSLRREVLLMTDWYTDELFSHGESGWVAVTYPISRLVVDPERFTDDSQEAMAAIGMGVIYTRTSNGTVLRDPPSDRQRQSLLNTYYFPHHKQLDFAVQSALDESDHCLLVDCHSFPKEPLPYEMDQSPERPDICIGTDEFHTPPAVADAAVNAFEGAGFKVAVNRPFAGALVPMKFFGQDPRVMALMVEVNRSLYMDEGSGRKLGGFVDVQGTISRCLRELSDTVPKGASSVIHR